MITRYYTSNATYFFLLKTQMCEKGTTKVVKDDVIIKVTNVEYMIMVHRQ